MVAADPVAIERPGSAEEAAEILGRCAERGRAVRILGGASKAGWGNEPVEHAVELRTGALDSIVEHNQGDLTAIVGAGAALAGIQAKFAAAGQMLALDPPDAAGTATIGGALASGDSGPLRHRYGAGRDLVVGMKMALSDGTIAKSGGKVIKNVAGYDLAKLLTGSFGTLGLIVEVAVRLHPLPESRLTVRAAGDRPEALGRASAALAGSHLEVECLDARWADGAGEVLARFAGVAVDDQAENAARMLADAGLEPAAIEPGEPAWEAQRAAQRSDRGSCCACPAPAPTSRRSPRSPPAPAPRWSRGRRSGSTG